MSGEVILNYLNKVFRSVSLTGEYFAVKKCEKLKLAAHEGGIVKN